ncbi:MAG TPA: nucleoside-triphosphatase [Victivallales bacterium]|nr:nucleoside-triphosphatase [Victivallales bacterium]
MGDIRIGKSTMIKNVLKPFMNKISGFYVQRIYKENQLKGFRFCTLSEGEYKLDNHITSEICPFPLFIEQTDKDKWKINEDVFIDSFNKAFDKEKLKEIILMDEIGGFEFDNAYITKCVFNLLDKDKPIIGVIKSPRSKEIMDKYFPIDSILMNKDRNLVKLIKHKAVEIIHVNNSNKNEIQNKIKSWVGANLNDNME